MNSAPNGKASPETFKSFRITERRIRKDRMRAWTPIQISCRVRSRLTSSCPVNTPRTAGESIQTSIHQGSCPKNGWYQIRLRSLSNWLLIKYWRRGITTSRHGRKVWGTMRNIGQHCRMSPANSLPKTPPSSKKNCAPRSDLTLLATERISYKSSIQFMFQRRRLWRK